MDRPIVEDVKVVLQQATVSDAANAASDFDVVSKQQDLSGEPF